MKTIQKYQPTLFFPFPKELLGIMLVISVFLAFPYGIRQLDFTAAALDPGIISAVILAILAILIFKALTWWLIRSIWPVMADYSEKQFEDNFKAMLSGHKVIVFLTFYLLILYAFVIVLAAVI